MSIVIIASFSETNQDDYTYLNSTTIISEAETFNGITSVLDSAKFRIGKTGAPTGNVVAKIYAVTGVFGTNSKPTGSALATSDAIDVTTIPLGLPPANLITFLFSGANRINLLTGTVYAIAVEYSGGDVNNKIAVGRQSTAPLYPGDGSSSNDIITWNSQTYDNIFYVYGAVGTVDDPHFAQMPVPIHFPQTRQFIQ